jgi:uncharacterized protein
MNTQEREVIDDLFDKLREAERHAGPREPVAEAHIRSRIEAQPGAPLPGALALTLWALPLAREA